MKAPNHVNTLFVILIASSTCLAGVSDGLVAYYPFNGNADDTSGNGHHGGIFGALLTSGYNGHPNSAYEFDGINDYVNVPYSAAFQLPAFTLSAWIRPTIDLRTWAVHIVAQGEDWTSDHAAAMLGSGTGDPAWAGTGIRLYYEDNGDSDFIYDSGVFPALDKWSHVAASRNLIGDVKVYVDGACLGSWSGTPAPTTECFQDYTIGAYWTIDHPGGPHVLGGTFPGGIDEVRIYNRALSGDEIAKLATIPAPAALLLGTLGTALVGWLRRRRTL